MFNVKKMFKQIPTEILTGINLLLMVHEVYT